MLKSAALLVMLVAAPAFAQERPRTDLATVRNLAAQVLRAIEARTPADSALAVAQVSISDEVAAALRARPAVDRLKASSR
jgi:hypothetical protein